MEKLGKVRIICTNCLGTKTRTLLKNEPEDTRVIIGNTCSKCCVESDDPEIHYDENMIDLQFD